MVTFYFINESFEGFVRRNADEPSDAVFRSSGPFLVVLQVVEDPPRGHEDGHEHGHQGDHMLLRTA